MTKGRDFREADMTSQSDIDKIRDELIKATTFVQTMVQIAKNMRATGNGDRISDIVKHGDQALDRIGEAKEALKSLGQRS
jgi:hypothetical protein